MKKLKRIMAMLGSLCLLTGSLFTITIRAEEQNTITFTDNGIDAQGDDSRKRDPE